MSEGTTNLIQAEDVNINNEKVNIDIVKHNDKISNKNSTYANEVISLLVNN